MHQSSRCRLALALVFLASSSCALYYMLSVHHENLMARAGASSGRTRIDNGLNSSSVELALNLVDSESIHASSLPDVDTTEANGAPVSYNRDSDLQTSDHSTQNGKVVKDAQGLLVEVAPELDIKQKQSDISNPINNLKQTKIINGISAPRSTHPYIVRIHSSNPETTSSSFFCGGTLISPDIIATAAHCIGDEEYVDIYSVELETVVTYKIAESRVHTLYDRKYFGYDYALIKIEGVHLKVVTVDDGSNNNEPYFGQ
jgi:hypothetical protein